jgi:ABC-type branched-subunit amino acid transport system permease subunit
MIQRLFTALGVVRDGLTAGLLLGIGLIFLTLIGLPSDDSEQLAAISVELFVVLTAYIAWRIARQEGERILPVVMANALAVGVVAGGTLLLFLSIINSWHADGTDVEGLYFAKMNTYPVHVLSGVPLEELEPNPEVNPFTGELPPGAELRTTPFRFGTTSEASIFSLDIPALFDVDEIELAINGIGVTIYEFHIGGLYGLLMLLMIGAGIGGGAQLLVQRINWESVWEQMRETRLVSGAVYIVPRVLHWVVLSLPLLIFILFWLTVEHERSSEGALFAVPLLDIQDATGIGVYDLLIDESSASDSFQPIDLTETFNLTSDSLVDAPSLQLGIAFLVIIFAMIAIRAVHIRPTSLGYIPRFLIPFVIISVLLVVALIRIESSDIVFFAPNIDIFGLDAMGWTRLTFGLVALGLLLFVGLASNDPRNFELVYTVGIGATVFLISPLFMNQYQTFVMGRVMLAVMFGLGLNIVVGYAGLLDLGYVAFYAIGAYTFAFVAVESEQFKLTAGQADTLGWTMVAALLIAPLVIFIGLAILGRLPNRSGTTVNAFGWKRKAPVWNAQPSLVLVSFLMFIVVAVTLSFGDVLQEGDLLENLGLGILTTDAGSIFFSPFLITIVAALLTGAFAGIVLGFPVLRLRGDYLAIVTLGFGEIISLALRNLDTTTGGPSGALGIPKPVPDGTSIPVSNLVLLYISIVGAILVSFVSLNLRNSRIGRAWLAIRSDEDIAQAMGINLVNLKLLAFSIGAAMAALAGMIFASRQNSIFPDDFNLEVSINVLSLVIIGGMGSVPGVVIGSIVLIGLPELLRPVEDYRIMAFGLLLILTMVTRPQGLLPAPPPELEARARALTHNTEDDSHG